MQINGCMAAFELQFRLNQLRIDMTTKHTPGPWKLVKEEQESMVASWHIAIGDDHIGMFPYKRIYSDDRTQSGLVKDDEKMANAILLSSAPDLLSALRTLLTAIEDDGKEKFDGHYKAFLESVAKPRAIAAIAKATGR